MASYRKRGDKYEVTWRDGGRGSRQRSRTVPTLRAVKALIREIEECKALGRRWEPQDSAQADLVTAFDAYLKEREVTMSAATVSAEDVALDLFCRHLVDLTRRRSDDLTLDLLSRDRLVSFTSWLRDVREVSDLTIRQYVRAVERAWRWLFDSDSYGERVPRPKRLNLPAASPALAPVAPTWAEMDLAIAKAWEMAEGPGSRGDAWLPVLWTILRYTGLRRRQALGLEWPDVDLRRAQLVLPTHLCKTALERKFRVRPLAPPLVEFLAGLGVREGRIVPAPKKPNWTWTKEPWKRAGLERLARQPQHAFRDGHYTGLLRLGVPEMIAEMLQGRSGGTGRRHYADPVQLLDDMRRAVEMIPPIGGAPAEVTNELGRRRELESGQ